MADSTKSTGVMFGGLRAVPVDPDLDPPAGGCFNCWKRGHRRIECPQPQVSPLCFNCGRREVTLNNCPRCSSRHREYLTRVREKERHIKRKQAKRANTSADRKLVKAVAKMRITGGGNPARIKNGNSESSRMECGSAPSPPPPQTKRTRANSNSRRYYFHLHRETPEGEHSRYSSRETILAEDDDIGSCTSNERKTYGTYYKTGPKIDSRSGKSDGACEQMSSSYGSCVEGKNNMPRDENRDDNERRKPSRDGAAARTDSYVDGKDNCSMKYDGRKNGTDRENNETPLNSNWSAHSTLSSYGQSYAKGSLLSSTAVDMDVKNDVQTFLRFLDKISNQPVTTQEILILQVISERERLLSTGCNQHCGQQSVGIKDPLHEYSNLVDAIAHLPMETQNIVLSGIAAEHKYLAEHITR